MDIKFLGTGWFDDIDCGNSSAILSHPQGNILIDCGATVYEKIRRNDLQDSIDYVLLTHLHGDHMGSLFALIAKKMKTNKVVLLYPDEWFKELLYKLLGLWFDDHSKFVDFKPLHDLEGIRSIDTINKHFKNIQTYAYVFEDEDSITYYSGDLNDLSVTTDFLKWCDTSKKIIIFHETTWREWGKVAHCFYKDIIEALEWYEVYLYHIDHLQKPDDCTLTCVAEIEDLLI